MLALVEIRMQAENGEVFIFKIRSDYLVQLADVCERWAASPELPAFDRAAAVLAVDQAAKIILDWEKRKAARQ